MIFERGVKKIRINFRGSNLSHIDFMGGSNFFWMKIFSDTLLRHLNCDHSLRKCSTIMCPREGNQGGIRFLAPLLGGGKYLTSGLGVG